MKLRCDKVVDLIWRCLPKLADKVVDLNWSCLLKLADKVVDFLNIGDI